MPVIRHILPGFPPSASPSPHATEVDGFVYLTGQFPRDLDAPDAPFPEGITAQTQATLRNMARVLKALGLGWENLVSMRVFLTDFARDYEAMNAAYGGIIPVDCRPVRTCVGVTALVRGALIEMDCVARR
ncbi:RidA family protein [Rhodovarius lipocyclicus]|uniref:RidA family protein n=1 Tax=Rhodovarius lipocyclicus TaxID=268410 RepID=UPI0013570587|nr:RidA family protein [Rhodovarius lipocyclicus]